MLYFVKRIIVLIIFIIPILLFIASQVNATIQYYSIQLSAYQNKENATKEVARLKKLGHNAFYRSSEVKVKGRYFRVYVERFESKKEAENEAEVLRQLEIISGYLIRVMEETTQISTRPKEGNIDDYYLHISSYKQENNAEKEVKKLREQGYSTFFTAEGASGETWFRVHMGPFEDEK